MIKPFTDSERAASKEREIKNSGPIVLRPVLPQEEKKNA